MRARALACVAGPAKTVSFMGSSHFFALLARNKSIGDKLINSVHAQRPAEAAERVSRGTVRTYTWEIVHRKCKRVAENFGQQPSNFSLQRAAPRHPCTCLSVL